MDDAEFKRRLSEVADWKIPESVYETTVTAKKKRGRKSAEEQYQEEHEQVFLEMFNGKNPTVAPMITSIKKQACTCESCGKFCEQGREIEAKLHIKNNKKAWRQKCVTCDRFQNPFTGEFNLTGSAASIKFNDFMRETKGVYKTKGNELREQVTVKTKEKTVTSNSVEIITLYHEKNATK